jgi:hypothetical protein
MGNKNKYYGRQRALSSPSAGGIFIARAVSLFVCVSASRFETIAAAAGTESDAQNNPTFCGAL